MNAPAQPQQQDGDPDFQQWVNDHHITAAQEEQQSRADFSVLLNPRKFDVANPPEKAVPRYTVEEQTIATAGNIEVIHAQAKAGKTAFIGAILAAGMQPGTAHLGVVSTGTGSILHFDTEQSRYDHHQVVLRALRRAELPKPPPTFDSYCLTDVAVDKRREAIFSTIEETPNLWAVVIDGVADLVRDPNNAEEAFAIVDRLHQTAIKANTVIFCVLHENPGLADNSKTRGHLGSQLERKAETPIRLLKDKEGITTVFAERARNCHISQDMGPRFAYDVEKGLHLPVETREDGKRADDEENRKDLIREIECVFEEAPNGILAHSALLRGLQHHFNLKPSGATTKYKRLKKSNILKEAKGGGWMINPKA